MTPSDSSGYLENPVVPHDLPIGQRMRCEAEGVDAVAREQPQQISKRKSGGDRFDWWERQSLNLNFASNHATTATNTQHTANATQGDKAERQVSIKSATSVFSAFIDPVTVSHLRSTLSCSPLWNSFQPTYSGATSLTTPCSRLRKQIASLPLRHTPY